VAQHARKYTSSGPAAAESTGDAPPQVRAEMELVVKQGVPGITAIAMKNGMQIFRLDVGKIDSETQYPVASASKWMTAALVMTVVDENKLSLDDPVSQTLPQFEADAGRVTLRELLAQTSGEGSLRSMVDLRNVLMDRPEDWNLWNFLHAWPFAQSRR
jgi:CubicO group peptidase (beta-lactamase class C family)